VQKTKNHLQIMALVLIKSDSEVFCTQISSQNSVADLLHPMGDKYKSLLSIIFIGLSIYLAVN